MPRWVRGLLHLALSVTRSTTNIKGSAQPAISALGTSIQKTPHFDITLYGCAARSVRHDFSTRIVERADGGSAAAIMPASVQANASLVDWEEPDWDDSDRPEGGGTWHVKWFNRTRGFGFVRNDAGEEMRVDKDALNASGISLSEMRSGRSFIVRWKRDDRTKIPVRFKRV